MSFISQPFHTSFLLVLKVNYFKAQASTVQAKIKNIATLKLPEGNNQELITRSITIYKGNMIAMQAPGSLHYFYKS